MKKYSEMLELKINPYDLRHCFATGFLRNGGNAFSLQRTLGHTDFYLAP
jgi:site-specific recombinase XerD